MASIIKVDTIQDQDGNNIINESAGTITIGKSGDTVQVASGAEFVGGGIQWQSDIKTSAFTAVAGEGYWVNTTSSAITITLPASASVGDQIIFTDYARTWGTNNITINTNSLNYQGNTSPNPIYNTNGQSVNIVYSGATQGWIPNSDDDVTLETPQFSGVTDFLVIAGGGSGAYRKGGGGGAGGYRNSYSTESSGGGGSSESSLTLSQGTTYTITVGAGGASVTTVGHGNSGSDSSISGSDITTITSTGGGGGSSEDAGTNPNVSGGSGGGGAGATPLTGGSGTANQGFDGGDGESGAQAAAGGGGGAGVAGSNGVEGTGGGNGGNGLASSITGSSVSRGGGGGGNIEVSSLPGGSGGTGGGGDAGAGNPAATTGTAGTANTGGGGGGCQNQNTGAGGSGVVILRFATADYSGTTTGSPTVTTDGTDTILTFTGSGSYTP
jgi:hypothetical protein